ncbi:hypothetical protein B296_00010954 [Ensete ventricosum]|uniref:Uncharacterized protein n=1 Tax=Ensete ventricosum TaxID=4639 RepID=A0A426YUK6_ENSVE|nr:hypothetical protein B296_00010954 [Ensete ventricosum]
MASSSGSRPSTDGLMSSSSTGSIMRSWSFLQRCSRLHDGNRGGGRPGHGWSGSNFCPSYLVVQSFFLDMREGSRCHKSVWLPRLYFSSNL